MRTVSLGACMGQSPPGGRPTARGARSKRRSNVVRPSSPSVAVASSSPSPTPTSTRSSSYPFDAVVIGSGLGGLSCAALLSKYGLRVRVLEAHSEVGGAAHSWTRRGAAAPGGGSGGLFRFESGPSLFSGMSPESGLGNKGGNPMAHVLAAAGVTAAELRFHEYDAWQVSLPGPKRGGGGGAAARRRVRARVGSAGFLELLPLFSEGPAARPRPRGSGCGCGPRCARSPPRPRRSPRWRCERGTPSARPSRPASATSPRSPPRCRTSRRCLALSPRRWTRWRSRSPF